MEVVCKGVIVDNEWTLFLIMAEPLAQEHDNPQTPKTKKMYNEVVGGILVSLRPSVCLSVLPASPVRSVM